ncbi:MAG: hypothetical protein JRD68_15335 [Deltaproteobacteria bacterium]|nr:hypothetical protein [Deltaproteobacteria bacterium]
MKQEKKVEVLAADGEPLNGLGQMMLQYLEQNFNEFDYKSRKALGLRGVVTIEVEKGIASTLSFMGEKIVIQNGIGLKPTLHLQGPYLAFTKFLSGQASPYLELLKRNIKLKKWPTHPIRCIKILNFLKIPAEFTPQSPV